MSYVKAVSIDLWLTLITANPASHKARTALLAKALSIAPSEEFGQLLRAVSRKFDLRSEKTGLHFGCADRIKEIAHRMQHPELSDDTVRELVAQCQSSIRNNRPSLLDPDAVDVLMLLRQKGIKLALVSNTGYPEGSVMREIVKELGIAKYFDAMIFSDEVDFAKPSPAIYQMVCDMLDVEPHELLHVGDSRAADYDGAINFGAHALLFNPSDTSVDHEQIRTLREAVPYVLTPEPVKRFPLYELTEENGTVVDRYGRSFCGDTYSRFKYGDIQALKAYGYMLADLFMWRFGARVLRDPESFVIAPFAYMHVPTAAGNMMEWFYERLGEHMRKHGLPCIERISVYKKVSNHANDHQYAKVTLEERKRILARARLSVDKTRLAGKTIVLIDDVYITGSSEGAMLQAVSGSGARDIAFLYVARMDSTVALRDPKVEDRINHRQVKTLDDLAAILTPGKYRINLRNCKFILDAPIVEVKRFLSKLETTVLSDLHETILANSYYLEQAYMETCAAIEAELVFRGSAPEGTVRLGGFPPTEFSIPDGRHPDAIDRG